MLVMCVCAAAGSAPQEGSGGAASRGSRARTAAASGCQGSMARRRCASTAALMKSLLCHATCGGCEAEREAAFNHHTLLLVPCYHMLWGA